MSLITEDIRAKATEFYRGHDVCMVNARRLLREVGLPNGLLPLQDVEECGYIKETGFVWLKQKQEIQHKFEKIDKLVKYGKEVTAQVEECKIKKLTGVKAKEFVLWVVISDISVDSPTSEKIIFKNGATGIFKTFPTNAFVIEEPPTKEEKKEEDVATAVKEVALGVKEKVEVEAAAAANGVKATTMVKEV